MLKIILRLLVACAVGSLSVSCVTKESTAWQTTVDEMAALHQDLKFPQYLAHKDATKQGTEFDVNRYLLVLTHLKMQPGYVLDYVYHYDGMGGSPILYARPADVVPYATEADFTQAMTQTGITKPNEQYIPYLQIEDSTEGYFEYVVFRMMASQFYLFWHSAYNDRQIICDHAALESLFKQKRMGYPIPITASLQARMLKLEPIVTLEAETATVQVITFSNWKGFVQETWTIDRKKPHTVLSIDSKVLVPYDCGIMF